MEKLNLTQQKHTFTNQNKCTTTQNKHKKLKPGLVASDNIRSGKGDDLFWFWRFIILSLTYLDTYPLNYSPRTHTGSRWTWIRQVSSLLVFFLHMFHKRNFVGKWHTCHNQQCQSVTSNPGKLCDISVLHHSRYCRNRPSGLISPTAPSAALHPLSGTLSTVIL